MCICIWRLNIFFFKRFKTVFGGGGVVVVDVVVVSKSLNSFFLFILCIQIHKYNLLKYTNTFSNMPQILFEHEGCHPCNLAFAFVLEVKSKGIGGEIN